ncbi:MAG: hypothetical protein RML73_14665 [Anaerolineae bacterium]|nr:hypothetical protein [Anaerolineae bacterium]
MSASQRSSLDEGVVFWGIMLGILVGTGWALFNLPSQVRQARQKVLERGKALRNQTDADAVAKSIEQGKSLARR